MFGNVFVPAPTFRRAHLKQPVDVRIISNELVRRGRSSALVESKSAARDPTALPVGPQREIARGRSDSGRDASGNSFLWI